MDLNFIICVIWALVVRCVFQYELDNFSVFDHWKSIFQHSQFFWFFFIVSLLCSLFINVLRFLIIPLGLIIEGGLASLCGMMWATCICGIGVTLGLALPSMASMCA